MITRRNVNLGLLSAAVATTVPRLATAQDLQPIELPAPRKDSGKPLMQAVGARRSIREYSDRPLPPQVLSDLLWVAFGINRPRSGDRTAPSWRHAIETEIYAVMTEGVWRYDPSTHRLLPHLHSDIRAQTGTQDFPATAPLNLVYVANGDRMGNASPEDKRLYASVDAGCIGENVYLFCASEGLATVLRASVDREALARTIRLDRSRFITFAQTVGYPKD